MINVGLESALKMFSSLSTELRLVLLKNTKYTIYYYTNTQFLRITIIPSNR